MHYNASISLMHFKIWNTFVSTEKYCAWVDNLWKNSCVKLFSCRSHYLSCYSVHTAVLSGTCGKQLNDAFSLSPECDWDHGLVWCVTDVGAWPTFTSTKWGHWSTDCRCYPLSNSHGLCENHSWTIAFSTCNTWAHYFFSLDRLVKYTQALQQKQTVCSSRPPNLHTRAWLKWGFFNAVNWTSDFEVKVGVGMSLTTLAEARRPIYMQFLPFQRTNDEKIHIIFFKNCPGIWCKTCLCVIWGPQHSLDTAGF